jgi:hypothetical protein
MVIDDINKKMGNDRQKRSIEDEIRRVGESNLYVGRYMYEFFKYTTGPNSIDVDKQYCRVRDLLVKMAESREVIKSLLNNNAEDFADAIIVKG